MAETKTFPTGDVLSAITGYLCTRSGIGGVYEVLGWMTGESLFTHQLPRVGREAAPVVLALHPHLAPAIEEAKGITRETWESVLQGWEDRYGPEIAVPRMNADQHDPIDPMSELAEMVHPSKILVIRTDGEG